MSDKNISSEEFDKLLKYKDLETEIARMWYLNPTIILVVIGALGMIIVMSYSKESPDSSKCQDSAFFTAKDKMDVPQTGRESGSMSFEKEENSHGVSLWCDD